MEKGDPAMPPATLLRRTVFAALACAALLPAAPPAEAGATLDGIRRLGYLRCGVSGMVAGMSLPDATGRMQGYDAEMCRAVAVAIFNDAEKVRFVPTTAQTRFTALQSGEVDMLSRTTALTLNRDSQLGLTVTAATFWTGQGFLVNKRLNVTEAKQLNGATVCATSGSEIERNIADWASTNKLRLTTVAFDTPSAILDAFLAGRCDAISNDMINLSANRRAAPNPANFVLLPDIIAKEPQGILVRNGDAEFAQLTRWAFFAMVQAEEFGLTRANVAEARAATQDAKIRRFLGLTDNVGRGFGSDNSFAYEIVRQVGNYGEVFERTAGRDGLGMDRGPNRLWTDGGLHVSWLWQ